MVTPATKRQAVMTYGLFRALLVMALIEVYLAGV